MQKTTGIPKETVKITADSIADKPATKSKATRKPSALRGRLARDHGLDFF